jgi:hypothetical protein
MRRAILSLIGLVLPSALAAVAVAPPLALHPAVVAVGLLCAWLALRSPARQAAVAVQAPAPGPPPSWYAGPAAVAPAPAPTTSEDRRALRGLDLEGPPEPREDAAPEELHSGDHLELEVVFVPEPGLLGAPPRGAPPGGYLRPGPRGFSPRARRRAWSPRPGIG